MSHNNTLSSPFKKPCACVHNMKRELERFMRKVCLRLEALAQDVLALSLSGQTSPAKPTYQRRGAKLYYPVAQCHFS